MAIQKLNRFTPFKLPLVKVRIQLSDYIMFVLKVKIVDLHMPTNISVLHIFKDLVIFNVKIFHCLNQIFN